MAKKKTSIVGSVPRSPKDPVQVKKVYEPVRREIKKLRSSAAEDTSK